ncbi:MAG: DUF934 domain-containing protein [Pseudomonadales bacterium]|nr:DUF934 domain-containing protein [Pseudomonadales bacterium]
MPKLIKENQVTEDDWLLVSADEANNPLPEGKLIVPLELWNERQSVLLARDHELGVWLDSNQAPELIGDRLSELALVAINFPAFTDGRGYSYAQVLRGRLNFAGELRAFGDVGKDQMFFMKRCGFDSYLLPDEKDPIAALQALSSFSDTYQSAQDQPIPAFRRNG